MKKQPTILATALLLLSASCSSHSGDIQVVIDKYCELNMKEHNAPAGPEKEAAAAEKKNFEKEVDDKYFKDNNTYQLILNGMKKCDAGTPIAGAPGGSTVSAYSDAVTTANAYCALVDQSITSAQNESDANLKKVVATKVMFEKDMEASYQANPARRDSILKLIAPCMEKEVKFRHQ